MKKFNNKEEAFASQNFDPTAVVITGVPPQHLEAAKAFINLCVAHDAVNPEFKPDYTNMEPKYEIIHNMGSPSGDSFSCGDYGGWRTDSCVGSRLASESIPAAKHVEELFHEDFKVMKVYNRKI